MYEGFRYRTGGLNELQVTGSAGMREALILHISQVCTVAMVVCSGFYAKIMVKQ